MSNKLWTVLNSGNTKRWITSWQVQSESSPSKFYTVSRAETGEFGCSCPAWSLRRRTCKHIRGVVASLVGTETDEENLARLRFIAKINGLTLSCENCAARKVGGYCDGNDRHYRYGNIPARDLLFAEGDKKTFYVLGRCCTHYEKSENA